MDFKTGLFIDGEFVRAADGRTLDVLNPHDNSVLCQVAEGDEKDIDRAVEAAQRAFPAWAAMAAGDRGRLLLKLADLIEERADYLCKLESLDTGHPIRDTQRLDIVRTAMTFRYFGGMADKLEGSVVPVDAGFLNYVQREPIGVVGQVVPWNFPLMFTSWKMAPALAAGNCVVIKPAELTPLSTLEIASMMHEVGFPAGVVNVVVGFGHTAGQRLAEHTGVGKIAFTGSTQTGRKIVEASTNNLKKIQLELGGKGPNIVFGDANLPAAIGGSAFGIFHNQGQACIAGSRLMLHESIADQFLEKFIALAESIKLGNPMDPATEMGPLTSQQHLDRVLHFIDLHQKEGGKILSGGEQPGGDLAGGCYVKPTIVEADASHTVFREEVFGPFVSVTRFKDDEEALAIANDTRYGLGSGLWTQDITRAHQFANKIKAGMVWINCYKRVHPGSPFGGVGESGYGREMGFEVMREYTQPKSVWVNVDAKIPPFYPR